MAWRVFGDISDGIDWQVLKTLAQWMMSSKGVEVIFEAASGKKIVSVLGTIVTTAKNKEFYDRFPYKKKEYWKEKPEKKF